MDYQAANKRQQGDTAINLLSLIQSYFGRTWAFTLANQLLRNSLWKHRNEEGHVASAWFHQNLFPSALPCATGHSVLVRRLCSIAPSLQANPYSSVQEHTSRSLPPLHLTVANWHQVIQCTSLVISPILYERGSWKIAFGLNRRWNLVSDLHWYAK